MSSIIYLLSIFPRQNTVGPGMGLKIKTTGTITKTVPFEEPRIANRRKISEKQKFFRSNLSTVLYRWPDRGEYTLCYPFTGAGQAGLHAFLQQWPCETSSHTGLRVRDQTIRQSVTGLKLLEIKEDNRS
ncbi:hypothetical protein DN748_12305 [Sinomicrobium soli]|nr:hypothetical protein DN748_12305 [Sinomicrobium sp. N-1-3-6]